MTKKPWSRMLWAALLAVLSVLTLLVHGYHPLAEDGGVYVAGIYLKLDASLFPHDAAFVRGPMRYSAFAAWMAAITRVLHLPPLWAVFLAYIASTWLMLFAARQLLKRCVLGDAAQLGGIALLAVWWTLPIAGTSLLLMDPYVTARSFCTPLSVLAIAFALDTWKSSPVPWPRHPAFHCALCLAAAAALHQLMAAYALAFVLALQAFRMRRPIFAGAALASAALVLGVGLQHFSPAEPPALVAAAITRYYWFLTQWQWYELVGLAGPLSVLFLLLRAPRQLTSAARLLCRTCIFLGLLAALVALLFAHESAPVHMAARLQPLRVFLVIYAVMAMLLGAVLTGLVQNVASRSSSRWRQHALRSAMLLCTGAMAVLMAYVQRQSFPASWHLELPWRAGENPNPWERAFLWAKANTPRDALFALDANYITTAGEDAQTFRGFALRSAVPDYSKDGGVAAITPSLAEAWQRGWTAQRGLSAQADTVRASRLRPLGVTWMVLHADATTAAPCPYNNGVVKVCRLPTAP